MCLNDQYAFIYIHVISIIIADILILMSNLFLAFRHSLFEFYTWLFFFFQGSGIKY